MRNYKLYLDDILEATERIEKYSRGFTLEKMKKDSLVVDGVARNLEIIGEVAKNVPADIIEHKMPVLKKQVAGILKNDK